MCLSKILLKHILHTSTASFILSSYFLHRIKSTLFPFATVIESIYSTILSRFSSEAAYPMLFFHHFCIKFMIWSLEAAVISDVSTPGKGSNEAKVIYSIILFRPKHYRYSASLQMHYTSSVVHIFTHRYSISLTQTGNCAPDLAY